MIAQVDRVGKGPFVSWVVVLGELDDGVDGGAREGGVGGVGVGLDGLGVGFLVFDEGDEY